MTSRCYDGYVSQPTFASSERRPFLLPFLLAVLGFAFAALFVIHFFPRTAVKAEAVQTDVLPTTTVYKAQSIVVGQNEVAQTLFVASTVRVENGMRMPIYVNSVSLTLTDPTGAELTGKALSKQDIASVEQSFPKLKSLVQLPGLQDAAIDAGKSAQGVSVFSLSIPKTLWDARTSAVVKIDLYHQQSVSLTLPKS